MPAVFSWERCAQLIIRATRRRKNELTTTAEGKMVVWLNRLAPRLLDYLLARFSGRKKEGVTPEVSAVIQL